jgi:hypothetical protein
VLSALSRAEKIGRLENIERLQAQETFEAWKVGNAQLSDDAVYETCLAAGQSKKEANAWRTASIESKRRPPRNDR